jgi:predicted Zn-dependent protease with MMP-like domain
MMKLSSTEFDELVKKAINRIPEEIQQHLDNVMISVRRRPSREMIREMGMHTEHELLGLFQGVPLTERSITAPPLFPDTIFLFQEPLESICSNTEELKEQIEITIVHEVAHFVGMDEERLTELGYE